MLCHARPKKKKPCTVKVGNVTLPIYKGKVRGRDRFTVAYHEAGVRRRETFSTEGAARIRAGEIAVKIENSQRDMLALTGTEMEVYAFSIRELKDVGVSLLEVVREYAAESKGIQGSSILTAAKDYARRKTGVAPEPVPELVEEFLIQQKTDGARIRYPLAPNHANPDAPDFLRNCTWMDWMTGPSPNRS